VDVSRAGTIMTGGFDIVALIIMKLPQ